MALSGSGFDLKDFLGALGGAVRPGTARPVVVHAAELETLPAGEVHNPSTLAIAGRLPTVTFELFRQTIPPGQSSDMQRHYHETVHYVISGHGHSEIEDEHRGVGGGRLHLHPAVDLAPALQRLGRRTGRVPHH